ncbi:Uma2 family endonuclease [Nostocaceae cyanobacterium CENA357]|uniref:Uma2 family endonuclease n=1 Tax=Atlanticothrix silvestris CENA357 TaxID=1725252 RepID=A0A8J7HFK5_9CYAN|nr:Uma2 family endonuclease [Atlanticothrix silvestris]MBH8551616.1 Uma2 family endonuclease [Atlanticothrix silvestris CENA357]
MVIQSEELVKLPPLENGDRLTRDEFERRYHAMSNIKKAELIEGKVYMPSPVRAANHGRPHAQIITWLGVYCVATPGTDLIDNGTTRIDLDNEPQPDALIRIDNAGQSYISDDDYVEGAPELIVEIAASSASYDLYEKLNVYRRNGVQEYIVWQTYDKKLNWFYLRGQEYITLEPDADGVIKSEVFPGLWLVVSALIEGNLVKVLAVLQEGLNTQEHTNFIHQLSL